MRVSHRIPLTGTPVVATQIAGLQGAYYWWTPASRIFLLKHFGRPVQVEDVPRRAIAMLIVHSGDVETPNVTPLIPPKQPYRRAAWDFGFSAPKRKPTIERARNAIRAAEASSGIPPLVIERDEFIFIYASEQRPNGRVWVPYAWATIRGATAVAIREALKDVTR